MTKLKFRNVEDVGERPVTSEGIADSRAPQHITPCNICRQLTTPCYDWKIKFMKNKRGHSVSTSAASLVH